MKPPAFQFYARDFLADRQVQLMTLEQRGAYITLLCHCWIERRMEADPVILARLLHVDPPIFLDRIWPGLVPCFTIDEDGHRLRSPRLERVRAEQQSRAEHAASAARLRWQK